MATTYCSVGDVADFLNVAIDENSKPNKIQVEKLINRSEDKIDNRTGRAWRSITVTNEYKRLPNTYIYGRGHMLDLRYRNVVLTKIEVWNGTSYDDVTAMTTDYTLIAELGQLFIRGYIFSIIRAQRFRISYTYGETVVPKDITEACVKMVSIELINTGWLYDLLPSGTMDQKSRETTINQWKEDVDEIISRRAEIVLVD